MSVLATGSAPATVGRDLESLQEELATERRLRQKRAGNR